MALSPSTMWYAPDSSCSPGTSVDSPNSCTANNPVLLLNRDCAVMGLNWMLVLHNHHKRATEASQNNSPTVHGHWRSEATPPHALGRQ